MTNPPSLKMLDEQPVPHSFDAKLVELGIALPPAAAPVAVYVPAVEAGNMLFISGQLPFANGSVMCGRLGDTVNLEMGQRAARACALMIIAQIKAALGTLDRVERIVKLGVFVNSDPQFTDHAKVANGASELMVELFGDAGRHARAAVGMAALPMGAVVEVDAIVALRAA